MGLELQTSQFERYIPAFGGNRQRYLAGEEPDPCIVDVRPVTYADSEAIGRLLGEGERLSTADNLRFIEEHIGEIRGLVVEGTRVSSGRDLVRVARQLPAGFLGELIQAVLNWDRFSAGLKKKLCSPPGSADSPPASGGTAGSAGAGAST